MNDPVRRPEDQPEENMKTTLIWTGGALALVAGIAIYAGMSG